TFLTAMFEGYSLVAGILIGLSLAVPPGPMNAIIASESVKRSYVNGIKLGMGAMTADAIFLAITLIGVTVLFTGDAVKLIVSIAGGVILAYIAVMTIKSFNRPLTESDKEAMRSPYLTGLVIGITNPSQILWWITAGAALIANFNALGIVGFFIGIIMWVSTFSITLNFAGSKVKWLYPAVVLISGIVLLFFSTLLLYDGYML